MADLKKITIGMATYDDYDGVYFTLQGIRLQLRGFNQNIDYVVVDNNPDSKEGRATKAFCEKIGARYFEEREIRSTAIRNRVFEEALAEFVLCVDPHVLFFQGAMLDLLSHVDQFQETADLYHGVMLYDELADGQKKVTHMNEEWRHDMFGTWAHDERALHVEQEPFEIPMHGLGIFAMATAKWPGFHKLFKGFGGEEGYIHAKVDKAGGRTWCLPWLEWVHRFERPRSVPYPLIIEERITNYLIAYIEMEWQPTEVTDHFMTRYPDLDYDALRDNAFKLMHDYKKDPQATLSEWHAREEKHMQWHDTQIQLSQPIEIDVLGTQLLIDKVGVKWSAPD